MPLLILAAVLWLTPALAVGQCCGDCGGDGEVSISDLITAVNNALNGCPATSPTPTQPPKGECPIDFQDNNLLPGTPDCYYRGRWNQNCGDAKLITFWRSDSEFLIVNVLGVGDGLFFGAEVTGAGTAGLICWYTQEDASDCDQNPVSGAVTLAAGGGMLTIVPQGSPFTIDECAFAHYSGTLFTVDTPSAATAARSAVRLRPEALQRVRKAAAARHHQADFRRR